jgi:hypothetical protein
MSATPEPSRTATSYGLFQDAWWLNLVTEGNWEEASVSNNEGVVARLPFVKRRRFGLTILTHPPMTPYMGPWFRPSTAKAAHQFSERQSLTDHLLSKLPRHDIFSQNFWPDIPDSLAFHWSGFAQTTAYTSWIRDISDTKQVWFDFLDVARRGIRKAEKHVRIVVSNDLDRLCEIYRVTFDQQSMAQTVPVPTLRRVVDGCLRAGRGRLAFAEDDKGNTHAANFIVFDDRSAHYNIGASDKRFRTSSAASLLMWNSIEFAAQRSRSFDFEGSMVENISRFFRTFNPQITPILHVVALSRRAAVLSNLYNASAALTGRKRLAL